MWCSQEKLAFFLFINYAYNISTWMHVHGTTFEKGCGNMMWSEIGKRNKQPKKFYCMLHFVIFCLLQSTLPQLSALHHNNCMYIAHHLLTLGHQFRPKLPEPLNQSVASFVDLVPTIRQMGEKCFLEQLVSSHLIYNLERHSYRTQVL